MAIINCKHTEQKKQKNKGEKHLRAITSLAENEPVGKVNDMPGGKIVSWVSELR